MSSSGRFGKIIAGRSEDFRYCLYYLGYSSAQILGLFKQNNNKAAEETRPCTAAADNTRTLPRDERDFRHSVNDRRIKSAGKPAFRYK